MFSTTFYCQLQNIHEAFVRAYQFADGIKN